MADPDSFPLEGGCDCKAIRYRMETAPLIVHCRHCRWCQRESGSAFALNAMIESDRVTESVQRHSAARPFATRAGQCGGDRPAPALRIMQ